MCWVLVRSSQAWPSVCACPRYARQWSLPPGPSPSTPRQALRDPSRSPSHGSPGSAGPVAAHSSRRHSGDTRLPPFLVLGDSTIMTPQIQGVSQRNSPHNTTKAFPVRWCGQAEPCVSAEGGQSWGRRRWNVGTGRASRPRTGWQLPPRPVHARLHGALTWASRSPPAARGHSRARGELLALRTRGQGEKRQVSGGENGAV